MNTPAHETATHNLRIDPAIKHALRCAAEREHRSSADVIAVMVCDHGERAGLVVPDQRQRLGDVHG